MRLICLTLSVILYICTPITAISPSAPSEKPKGPLGAKVLEVIGQQGYSQAPELELMIRTEVGGEMIFSELGGEIPLQESESDTSEQVNGSQVASGLPADSSVHYYGTFDVLERQIGLHIYPEGDSRLELAVVNYQNLEKLRILIREPSKPGGVDQPWWVLDLDGFMRDTDPSDTSNVKVFESRKGGLPAFVPLSDLPGTF